MPRVKKKKQKTTTTTTTRNNFISGKLVNAFLKPTLLCNLNVFEPSNAEILIVTGHD